MKQEMRTIAGNTVTERNTHASGVSVPYLQKSDSGNAIVETALTLPLVLMIFMIIWEFGLIYNQQISLTQATTIGAQVLQSDRMSTSNDPCLDTFNAIKAYAPTLTPSKIGLTLTLNNNAPINQTSCPGKQTQLTMGGPVKVQTTYPYTLSIIGASITSGTMSSGLITEIEY